jgi:tRNA A37 threonylcarbamoyladenosine synthetase subunit TsaC/SUA5/YrdC
VTLRTLAETLRPGEDHDDVLRALAETDWRETRLDLADARDRTFAARATAAGAALFCSFANFCAIAAHPHLESVRRVNRLKGRPVDQVGSVSTTRDRIETLFDWDALPGGLTRERVTALIDEFYERGPMGFRGPAAPHIPDHLASSNAGIRTTQIIAPGYRCPSNRLLDEVLELTGEDLVFITSANVSSTVTGSLEAAHYDLAGIQRDFGDKDGIALIGHRDEPAVRARYPEYLPMSTSILAFHQLAADDGSRPALMLERHGSLDAQRVRELADRHGFDLVLGERTRERQPLRDEVEGEP